MHITIFQDPLGSMICSRNRVQPGPRIGALPTHFLHVDGTLEKYISYMSLNKRKAWYRGCKSCRASQNIPAPQMLRLVDLRGKDSPHTFRNYLSHRESTFGYVGPRKIPAKAARISFATLQHLYMMKTIKIAEMVAVYSSREM